MLTSPLRQCIFTHQYLPTGKFSFGIETFGKLLNLISDFMIRLSLLKLPSESDPSQRVVYLLPDGILHPRFQGLSSKTGRYLICKKSVVPHLEARGSVRRTRMAAGDVRLHALFEHQVGSQLRDRVIQVSISRLHPLLDLICI